MSEAYLLGGRAYRSAATQTTWQQDNWTMALLRKHGLSESTDVLHAILACGEAAEFLAGWLVAKDQTWSPEVARENAAYFNGLTDPASKAQLYDVIGRLLTDFFPHGGSSSTASPTSSEGSTRRKPGRRRATLPAISAVSGPMSSPPSPSSTASE